MPFVPFVAFGTPNVRNYMRYDSYEVRQESPHMLKQQGRMKEYSYPSPNIGPLCHLWAAKPKHVEKVALCIQSQMV